MSGEVAFRFGTTVESIEQEACVVRARLSDGRVESAELLVRADGVHSQVRRLVFGPEARFQRALGYHTAAYLLDRVPKELPGANAFFMLTVPGRQVAVYPIRDGRLATFFLHRTVLAEPMFNGGPFRELAEAYGDLDWILPELLERCPHGPPDLYFDVVSQVEVPRWSAGRVVLAGDSCQCVSRLAGQGASLAVAGAYVLVEELAACEGDVPSTLDRYESRLRPAIRDKQAAGRRMANWFVPASSSRLAVRDLAVRLSLWPGVASLLRRGLAAESVLGL